MTLNQVTITIDADAIRAEAEELLRPNGKRDHARVLQEILNALEKVDFCDLAGLPTYQKPNHKHYRVLTVQEVLRTANDLNCGLCRNKDFVYAYNGEFWQLIDKDELENFLGEAAERLGIESITARDYEFKAKLYKQFLSQSHLPKPNQHTEAVLINFRNGTFEITEKELAIRDFDRKDFLTYRLPFSFEPKAKCNKWQAFLNDVLPDKSKQDVLAEYCGYVFARHLKLEKTLILFGLGANGKSVFFEVINAILGRENVSNVSLESLGKDQHYRALLANKLLNYAPEISNRLQAEKFKQLTSGEPIEARLPYGQPMILTNYARLAFNCNELPKDVEHTEAFFRRFLIILFDVTIPESKRNPNLAREIIEGELSGVFNWIIDGLRRLLEQNGFSQCDAVKKMLDVYKRESDSVAMFLVDEHYVKSANSKITVRDIFAEYKAYCLDNNYRPLGRNNFTKRLENNGIPRQDSYQPFFYMEKK
jgi:putative DNA primase/helicase